MDWNRLTFLASAVRNTYQISPAGGQYTCTLMMAVYALVYTQSWRTARRVGLLPPFSLKFLTFNKRCLVSQNAFSPVIKTWWLNWVTALKIYHEICQSTLADRAYQPLPRNRLGNVTRGSKSSPRSKSDGVKWGETEKYWSTELWDNVLVYFLGQRSSTWTPGAKVYTRITCCNREQHRCLRTSTLAMVHALWPRSHRSVVLFSVSFCWINFKWL